jgi:hypothetical protein
MGGEGSRSPRTVACLRSMTVAGFRGRVEDGTVSMFSTTSATIPHVHHLLNPQLTTHLNISNNLCSTRSFYPSDCVLVVSRLGGGGRRILW